MGMLTLIAASNVVTAPNKKLPKNLFGVFFSFNVSDLTIFEAFEMIDLEMLLR